MTTNAATNANDFYRAHRYAVLDCYKAENYRTTEYCAYYATKEEAEADVAERFGSIYKVVHLDDAACQEEAKRELGLLTWGPVWEIDGTEVAADLVRDHRRHLITWDQVKNQHRARTNSN